MKLQWFSRRGIFYTPVAPAGWLILALTLLFAIYRLVALYLKSHSVSDTAINFIIDLLTIGLAYTLVAFVTEKKTDAVTD